MNQKAYLIGLNHKTAPVEVRERFALGACANPDGTPRVLIPLGQGIEEVVVLSTCNRVEILAVGQGPEVVDKVLERWAGLKERNPEEVRPYIYVHEDEDAVEHLFMVASSLDSMVLGEPQILGQLKEAYRLAAEMNLTRVILNRLLHKAFSVAKRVRTETDIGSSAVSISYAAVELAKRIFGEMTPYKAMLIGAGEMAELAAAHLVASGIEKIFVANRTFERGLELAKQFKGEAVQFEDLFDRLAEADIIISSTGAPQAVIRAKDIKNVLKKRKNRPMFFIDIAVPRDIDPDVNNLDNVYLYDIDDLKEVVEENLAQRREEAARARTIVKTEVISFQKWMKSLDLRPTIVDLLEHGDEIGQKELAKTMKRLAPVIAPEHQEEARQAIETLVKSMARKLYHEPLVFLKRRSEEEDSAARFIDLTRKMFNLDDETPPPDAHWNRKKRTSPRDMNKTNKDD